MPDPVKVNMSPVGRRLLLLRLWGSEMRFWVSCR